MKIIDSYNEERHYEILTDLLKIYSPSKNEKEVGEYVVKFFENLGCQVHLDQSYDLYGGNTPTIFAKLEGSIEGEGISFSAHMDVIEPNQGVKLIREGNILKTDGTTTLGGDDKAGLATILYIMEYLKENKLDYPDLYAVITPAEEIGMLGAKNVNWDELYKTMNPSKNMLVLDSGGSPENICYQAPAAEEFEIRVKGKTAHAGMEPERGVNAIKILADIISSLKWGRIDEETTCNISQVEADFPTNIVPDYAYAKGEMRSHDEEKLKAMTEELDSVAYEAGSNLGGHVEVEFFSQYPALKSQDDLAFAKDFAKIFEAYKLKPELQIKGGGSDGNYFAEEGFNPIIVGVGMENPHTKDEYLNLDHMFLAGKVIISYLTK